MEWIMVGGWVFQVSMELSMDISHFEGLVITRELDSENPLITTKAMYTAYANVSGEYKK